MTKCILNFIVGNPGPGVPRREPLMVYYDLAEAHRLGEVCAFVTVGSGLDLDYARLLGINVDDLLLVQVSTGNKALWLAKLLVDSGEVDVVIVDLLMPGDPREGTPDDTTVGMQPRMMRQAMSELAGRPQSHTLRLFTNQTTTDSSPGAPLRAGDHSLEFDDNMTREG
jgi:RecA/RadA recombinase